MAVLGGILTLVAASAHAAEFGKLLKVTGDRQIVLGHGPNGKAPFAVRALDISGLPLPGVVIRARSTAVSEPWCGRNRDEFGFFGFNASFESPDCTYPPAGTGITGQDGSTSLSMGDQNFSPSAFLMAASADLGTTSVPEGRRIQFFSIVRVTNPPAGQPQVVVEYFHDTARNYFNTIDQAEIDALDAGTFAGWTREVGSFIAWPSAAAAPEGAVPVCRFFGSKFTSHFYTADPAECDAVVANFPDWVLETREAFWIFLPDKTTGACPENLMPVWRVYRPSGPNHRYVTDRNVRDTMVLLAGWIAEGYGPDAVIMCTPR